jgi:signal transduction histidine kinase
MKKILYVEDNKFDQAVFKRFIGESGDIDYTITSTIREAQRILDTDLFDVIVSDFSLSDGDAFDILSMRKDTPVIVTAGTGNEEIAVKLMKSGAKDYLIKDIDNNYLKILPVVIENTIKHKEAENALIRSLVELEQSKELQKKKDEFIGIASHELKTPLTSMKAYLQLLERELHGGNHEPENLLNFVIKTNNHISRLETLIGQLLDVSKIQAGKMQYAMDFFDFDSMVKDCAEAMQHISGTHTIEVKGNVGMPVQGDRQRLEQVLTNYLTNAVKYSPGANKVLIDVSHDEEKVTVEVRDFGIGISEEHQAHLFDRFFRVEDKTHRFSGLGIGLYISREIVLRHHGTVWVKSEKNKGTSFFFCIPLRQPA